MLGVLSQPLDDVARILEDLWMPLQGVLFCFAQGAAQARRWRGRAGAGGKPPRLSSTPGPEAAPRTGRPTPQPTS
jgi:hypothetical protein